MDGQSLVGEAILENQSHTVITTGNGEVSQPQQKKKDGNKNKMSEKQSEIQLY